jgi:hypothetical protein
MISPCWKWKSNKMTAKTIKLISKRTTRVRAFEFHNIDSLRNIELTGWDR